MEQLKEQEQSQVNQPKPQMQIPSVLPEIKSDKQTEDTITTALGFVTVGYGIYEERFEIAGKSVAYARANLSALFNIPAEAKARIDDVQVNNEQEVILTPNSKLEFIKAAGQKG